MPVGSGGKSRSRGAWDDGGTGSGRVKLTPAALRARRGHLGILAHSREPQVPGKALDFSRPNGFL